MDGGIAGGGVVDDVRHFSTTFVRVRVQQLLSYYSTIGGDPREFETGPHVHNKVQYGTVVTRRAEDTDLAATCYSVL